jgi:tryptophanyl-tRNA synthetase
MKNSSKVTPWEVEGNIDYGKLVKEFGIEPLKKLPDVFNENILFRRSFVFAARDIGRIMVRIRDKKPFVVMTGLMPTGKFHIGHSLIIQQVLFYQKLGAKVYIAVADIESYNARGQSLEDSRKIAAEYIKDYVALGLDLNKTEVYFQSDRSSDAKKANAYYRLQNLFSRHSTFNEVKGVYGEISPGKMMAALLQGADMYHAQLKEFEGKPIPTIIPVGIDQDPHIRLARDIARRFDNKLIPISSSYNLFLPGLKGGKMSASDPNSFIAFTDTPAQIKNKINKYAFSGGQKTLEEHRKKGGNPDVDVSFQYLRLFEEDDKKLEEIYEKYKSGEMLTGELKKYAIEKIVEFMKEHQKKRKAAEKIVDKFLFKE